jgi:anti-sigma factor RsiW
MICADVRLLWSRDRDGEASGAERVTVAEHLAGCADCRLWVVEVGALADLVSAHWSPVVAPRGFARDVAARLPAPVPKPSARGIPRWAAVAVASLLVVVLAAGTQPAALASLGLFLRQVVLREAAPPRIDLSAPLERVTFAEAQQRVSWRIREPRALPDGYRLVSVYVGEIHTFALGPTVWLQYAQGDAPAAPYLAIVQVRAGSPIDEPVAEGHSRPVTLPDGRSALVIEGRWTEARTPIWETGSLLRVILEDEDGLVIQLQADPRDGWTEAQLIEIANSLQ